MIWIISFSSFIISCEKASKLSYSRSLENWCQTVTVMWSHACWSCKDCVFTFFFFFLILWTCVLWLYYTMTALSSLITFWDLFIPHFAFIKPPREHGPFNILEASFWSPVKKRTMWNKQLSTQYWFILTGNTLSRKAASEYWVENNISWQNAQTK